MAIISKGENFKIEDNGKVTFLGYEGYWKEKVLMIKQSSEKKAYATRLEISVYKQIIEMLQTEIKKGYEDIIDNILITPYQAIILLLREKKIKPSVLNRITTDHEEFREAAVKIDGITFNKRIFPIIIRDCDLIATRNAENQIIP